jgi:hypothetical protein
MAENCERKYRWRKIQEMRGYDWASWNYGQGGNPNNPVGSLHVRRLVIVGVSGGSIGAVWIVNTAVEMVHNDRLAVRGSTHFNCGRVTVSTRK